jgi:hypothetical protein
VRGTVPRKEGEQKRRLKFVLYLVWSNSWTLAFTFDMREVNVRLLAAKGREKHYGKQSCDSAK